MKTQHYIAIKDGKATICPSKLSLGVKPNLPGYNFIGPYDTKGQAEKSIPIGMEYKGNIVVAENK